MLEKLPNGTPFDRRWIITDKRGVILNYLPQMQVLRVLGTKPTDEADEVWEPIAFDDLMKWIGLKQRTGVLEFDAQSLMTWIDAISEYPLGTIDEPAVIDVTDAPVFSRDDG